MGNLQPKSKCLIVIPCFWPCLVQYNPYFGPRPIYDTSIIKSAGYRSPGLMMHHLEKQQKRICCYNCSQIRQFSREILSTKNISRALTQVTSYRNVKSSCAILEPTSSITFSSAAILLQLTFTKLLYSKQDHSSESCYHERVIHPIQNPHLCSLHQNALCKTHRSQQIAENKLI